MFRALASAAVLLATTCPLLAQDVALANPGASSRAVVSACETVAADPTIADTSNGICITATVSFLDTVGAPSVPSDPPVQTLIVELLQLVQTFPECDPFDDEIAAAIRAASERVIDPDLKGQFIAAAEAVDACEVTNLGALGAPLEGETNGETASSRFTLG